MFYLDVVLFISSLICLSFSLIYLFKTYNLYKSTTFFSVSDLYDSFSLIDTMYSDPSFLDGIITNYNKLSPSDQDKIRKGFECGVDVLKFTISKNLNIPITFEKSPVPSGENKK